MTQAGPLAGLNVLITRPGRQGDSLAAAIQQQGGQVAQFPLLRIEPVTDPQCRAAIRQRVMDLDNYQLLIFVSTNAAHFGLEWIDRYWPQFPAGVKVMAVGPATAAVLERLPCEVQVSPAGMQSEDLLALPLLQQVRDSRIALFRGVGGRELLADSLRQRGAQVDYIETYERQPPAGDGTELLDVLRNSTVNVITVTSGQILETLCQLVDIQHNGLSLLPLLVPSQRIREKARELGFVQVTSCDGATDAAILTSLEKIARQLQEPR